jgi:hypothetical protein
MAVFVDVYIDNILKEKYGNDVSISISDICRRYELNKYFQVKLYKKITYEDGCMDNTTIFSQIIDRYELNMYNNVKIRNQVIMFINNLDEDNIIICKILHDNVKYNKTVLYKRGCCYDMKELKDYQINKIVLDDVDTIFENQKTNVVIKNDNKIFKEMKIFISDKQKYRFIL